MKVAVDLVIHRGDQVLLVRRKFPPFEGELALPGGFVEDNETTSFAAARELLEETGVKVDPAECKLLGVFDAVRRDPRGRVLSIAFEAHVPGYTQARAGCDAADAVWLTRAEALARELAFDHRLILECAQ